MNVWCLETWANDVGWNDGYRVMEFFGEVFDSAEAGKEHVIHDTGYEDVRWFQFRPDRWVGRTRGKHPYTSTTVLTPVYMQLTRQEVLTSRK